MRAAACASRRPAGWAAPSGSGLAARVVGRFGRATLPGGRPPPAGSRPGAGWTGARDLPGAAARVVPGLVAAAPTEGPREGRRAPARRSSAGCAQRSPTSTPAGPVPPRTPGAARRADAVALFVERVDDYRATVERCAADELGGAVAAALPRGRSVVVPDGLGLERARRGRSTTA